MWGIDDCCGADFQRTRKPRNHHIAFACPAAPAKPQAHTKTVQLPPQPAKQRMGYVPSCHDARYSLCSAVSSSMEMSMDWSLRRATCWSIS